MQCYTGVGNRVWGLRIGWGVGIVYGGMRIGIIENGVCGIVWYKSKVNTIQELYIDTYITAFCRLKTISTKK